MGQTYRQWSLIIAGIGLGLFAAFLTALAARALTGSADAAPYHLGLALVTSLWAAWRLGAATSRKAGP